jgi:hypothetical protein
MNQSQKPAPKASKDDTLQTVLTTLVVITVLLASGVGLYWWFQPEPSEPMMVQVKIDNHCEVVNEAFMAISEPDGAKAYFNGDLALLHTRSNSKVYVRSSDKYPAFYFESPRVDAARKVTIKTECQPERIQRTLDALKKQFQ